jgi:hypothetical protein
MTRCEAVTDRFLEVARVHPFIIGNLWKCASGKGTELRHPKPENVTRELVQKAVFKTSLELTQSTPYKDTKPVYKHFAVKSGNTIKGGQMHDLSPRFKPCMFLCTVTQ